MRFTLQELETLDNVLGRVKRTEQEDQHYLVGIEFIEESQLRDVLSQAEIDLLSDNFGSFSHRVHDVLQKYVQRTRTVGQSK